MTKDQLAKLLDDTANAITESNWYQENYFPNNPYIDSVEELLARKDGPACAMGRMTILFFNHRLELSCERGISVFGDVESTIDETFMDATGRDFSLSGAIIDENDEADHVVDIQRFLRRVAKELRE